MFIIVIKRLSKQYVELFLVGVVALSYEKGAGSLVIGQVISKWYQNVCNILMYM